MFCFHREVDGANFPHDADTDLARIVYRRLNLMSDISGHPDGVRVRSAFAIHEHPELLAGLDREHAGYSLEGARSCVPDNDIVLQWLDVMKHLQSHHTNFNEALGSDLRAALNHITQERPEDSQ